MQMHAQTCGENTQRGHTHTRAANSYRPNMRLHGCMGDAFANGGRVDGAGEVSLTPEETEDLWHTFNLGIGFCVVVPQDQTDLVVAACRTKQLQAWPIGSIVEGNPGDGVIGLPN